MINPDKDDTDNIDIFDLMNIQSEKIGELLDYNQAVVKICRQQADNWRKVARSYVEMATMANDIADDCALFARISIDRAGDVISTEYGITEVDREFEEEEEDEDG